jgi:hypothetical protein
MADECFRFRGGYSPYHDRAARHWREFRQEGADWVITDDIEGGQASVIESYVHFHPDFHLITSGESIVLGSAELRVAIEPFGARAFAVVGAETPGEGSWFCPEFGVAIRNTAIRFEIEHGDRRHFGYRIRLLQAGA